MPPMVPPAPMATSATGAAGGESGASTSTGTPAAPAAPAQDNPTAVTNYSIESERLICAAMLRPTEELPEPTLPWRLVDLISPDDFFMEQHKAIWTAVTLLIRANLAVSPAAINDLATRQELMTGGARYLGELLTDPLNQSATTQTLEQAAVRIKEMYAKRRLEATLRQALALVQSGQSFQDVAVFVEDDVANQRGALTSSRTGPQHQSIFLMQVIDKIESMQDSDRKFEGSPTGFSDLDLVTGGLPDENFIVLAGRPGMGKTAAALKLLNAAADDQRPALMFSLEMTGMALARRTIAREGHIDMGRLQTGELHDREFTELVESVNRLKDKEIYFDDSPGLTIGEICSRAREFRNKHPKALIVIDYLQKIAMDKDVRDPNLHAKMCSMRLQELARQLRCPVVALAQLNRDVEKRVNKRPMMSDLRESGQIEQDASIILFLYRDEYYNQDTKEPGVAEVIVAKNRDGATKTIKTGFDGRVMDFTPMGVMDHE